MPFKPMLAGKVDELAIQFPVFASAKLDGVRAMVMYENGKGVVVSRNLKPIPNAWVQKTFGNLPNGTDGELIFGDPCHPDAYRNTVSAVMRENGEPTHVCFHVFDNFHFLGGFQARFKNLSLDTKYISQPNMFVVPHTIIHDMGELDIVEAAALEAGYEGLMLRSLNGPYKQGRSTEKEGYLLKLKRFDDAEAVVLDTFEWEQNNNTAMTNALGHTERSSHKANMQGMDVLGGLIVKGLNGPYAGVEFRIGSGFSGAASPTGERAKLWAVRDNLVGKVVKYQFFPTGSKDKPRFPTYQGWRHVIDF